MSTFTLDDLVAVYTWTVFTLTLALGLFFVFVAGFLWMAERRPS